MDKKHYYGIDWLRVIACFGIVLMHIQANNTYSLSGFLAESMIPSFTNFTFLFMTISAFGMCNGYYEKVKNGKVNWAEFYKKRYLKVLPFFSIVVFADILFNHNLTSIIEAVPNLTLTRGFFPNEIEQIGVAWFLGVIFVFYAIFPLFCSLLSSKKSAWTFFIISLILNFVVSNYYGVERENIIYCLPFFMVGGLVYLYRSDLLKLNKYYILLITLVSILAYYFFGGNIYFCLLVSTTFLIHAISSKMRKVKIISFLSGISMEIYLSHMVMFRLIEKMHLNTIFGNGWLQYFMTVILVLICAICFSFIVKSVLQVLESKLVKRA